MSKTVLITGSSKRIGKSIAINLAKKGYNIIIHYNHSKKEANELLKRIKSFGVKAIIKKLDLLQTKEIEKFFKSLKKFSSQIDLLINNASIFEYDSLKSSTNELFEKHMNVNLKSPFFLSKYFAINIGKKKGMIINIVDQRVENISPYFTSYTISKAGLYNLNRSLALSLAPNIRVNAIAPGPTLKSIRQTENQFNEQVARTPLKRKVTLKDINNGINFLIDCKSITGQTLFLDSGQSLGWANTKSKKFIDD